jgi:hypothetical protein
MRGVKMELSELCKDCCSIGDIFVKAQDTETELRILNTAEGNFKVKAAKPNYAIGTLQKFIPNKGFVEFPAVVIYGSHAGYTTKEQ